MFYVPHCQIKVYRVFSILKIGISKNGKQGEKLKFNEYHITEVNL